MMSNLPFSIFFRCSIVHSSSRVAVFFLQFYDLSKNFRALLFYRNDDSINEDDVFHHPSGMDPDGIIESNWSEIIDNFDDMSLKEELLRGIYGYGFERPSAIQQRAILPCVRGRDVIAQAQSGTGKTATFSIAILQQIDTSILDCQALILAPTRELATQIQKVVIALGDYLNAECLA